MFTKHSSPGQAQGSVGELWSPWQSRSSGPTLEMRSLLWHLAMLKEWITKLTKESLLVTWKKDQETQLCIWHYSPLSLAFPDSPFQGFTCLLLSTALVERFHWPLPCRIHLQCQAVKKTISDCCAGRAAGWLSNAFWPKQKETHLWNKSRRLRNDGRV